LSVSDVCQGDVSVSVSDVCQGDVSVFPSGSPSSENCFNVEKLAQYMMENELKKNRIEKQIRIR